MLNRLKWIAISYATRPMVWGFVAFATLLISLAWLSPMRATLQTNYPNSYVEGLSITSHDSLEQVRSSNRQLDVTTINLPQLWYDSLRAKHAESNSHESLQYNPPDEAFFHVLREFPNLRFITYDGYFNRLGLTEVLRVTMLEELTIEGLQEFDLSQLRPLNHLRRLQLNIFKPPTGLATLEELPQLETVVWLSRLSVDDAVLAEMARLPHLRTLVLDFAVSAPANESLTTASFEPLRQSKSLDTLYVGEALPVDNSHLLRLAQAALPQLSVLPAEIKIRPPAILNLLMFSLFGSAIGIQLSSQFRGPVCRLAPHFRKSHALFAIGLLILVIAVTTLLLIGPNVAAIPAVIVATAWLTSSVSLTSMSALGSQFATNQERARMAASRIVVVVYIVLSLLLIVPRWSEPLLIGKWPAMLVVMLALTAFSAWLSKLILTRLVIWSSGSADAGIPDDMSLKIVAQLPFKSGWYSFDKSRELQIEAWAQHPPTWSLWNRLARLRAGNPPVRSVRTQLTMYFLGALFFFTATRLILPRVNGRAVPLEFVRVPLLICAAFILVVVAIRIAHNWRTRTLTMNEELMRPAWRQPLQNEMSVGFLLDLVGPSLTYAVVSAVLLNMQSDYALPARSAVLSIFAFAAVGMALTAGLGAVLIVIQRQWLASLIVVAAILSCLAGMISLFIAQSDISGARVINQTPWALQQPLWLPVLIGSALAIWMRQRWMKIQFGLRR